MKKKLCFVIQRYGLEINGGAEAYCRIYAEKFSDIYDITVVTTCAFDYVNWDNYYDEGISVINNVTVHRFKVDYPRDPEFSDFLAKTLSNPQHSFEQADKCIEMQGPYSTDLLNFIKDNQQSFDKFLFFTYLYSPTVHGIRYAWEKAVLIPFCHDEEAVYLKVFDEVFNCPQKIIYNTSEEMEFVTRRFNNDHIPSITTGIGLDIPPLDTLPPIKNFNLTKPYIIYMGRIDNCKGCDLLFNYFISFKEKYSGDLQLVLIGNELIPIPRHPDIISLGFVSEEEKYSILRECELLVLPSKFESLSIVVLEAFEFSKPVLVSSHCSVLKGHCIKSNGGLYFSDYDEFCECLKLLIDEPKLRHAMGKNGKSYINNNYQWDIITDKFTSFI